MRAVAVFGLMALVACSQQEEILKGERLGLDGDPLNAPSAKVELAAVSIPAVSTNATWTNPEGNAAKDPGNLTLSSAPSMAWSADAVVGSSRRATVSASPVVADGRVFVLGAQSDVAAFSEGGAPLWSKMLRATNDDVEEVSGGSLSTFNGRVFVATGFGQLIALDAATGAEIWRQDTEAAGVSSAIQSGDILYVSARNGTAFALNPANGKILWQVSGPASRTNTTSAASPTITPKWALFPFATGEIMSTFRRGGVRNWSAVVSGRRDGSASATIGDIVSGPVVIGGSAIVGNNNGQIVSLDMNSGERNWTTMEGVRSYVARAGRDVFFVNDKNEFLRVDSRTGTVLYRRALPRYTDARVRKRDEIHAHFGPVLANGRLILASSDGVLRFVDPQTGNVVSQIPLPAAASAAPAIANGTLYVPTKDGKLSAFR